MQTRRIGDVNHEDHVRLIEAGVGRSSGGVWADLGAGTGAFTLALRDVAGSEVEIFAVDRDGGALRAQRDVFAHRYPGARIHYVEADFTAPLALPPLDGILAANALHFVREQMRLLRRWRDYLKPRGKLVLVEYDTDAGNRWVPHPFSFATFGTLVEEAGYEEPVLLGIRPSRFLGAIYAAATSPM